VDLADWKQGGSFVGRTRALDALTRQLILRRRVTQRVDEPIGLLTHHNVLGREGRQFLGQLFDLLSEPMVNWLDADQIIAIAVRGPARCAS